MSVIHNGKTYFVEKKKKRRLVIDTHKAYKEKVKDQKYFLTLTLVGKKIKDISEIKGLENLTELEVLKLNGNKISEIMGLDNLVNLKYLNLRNNQISEIKGLENLVKLQELYLEKNPIKTLKGLDNLVNLKFLNLFSCMIDQIESFRNKHCLEILSFGLNPLYRDLKKLVSKKKKLRRLTEEERNNRGIDSKLWEIVDNTEFKLASQPKQPLWAEILFG